MIKAVLFDLGGVFFEDGTVKFLKLLSEKTKRTYDSLYPLFRQGKSLEYRENKITGKDFFDWVSQQLNSVLSPDEINNLWVSQYTEISGIRGIVLWLKELNLRVGILSDNVPERVKYLQDKYQFLDLFDPVIFSYDVNLTKTDLKIFKFASNKLKLNPDEVLFIDDRQIVLDVASQVGMKTILFKNVGDLKDQLKSYL